MESSRFEWFKALRTFLYDAYWPPFHPKLDYIPKDGVRIAKSMGANAIRFGTIGKWALFPSEIMPRHPELNGRDLLRETVEEARKAAMKVIAYVPVGHGLPGELVEKLRPEWAYVLDNGKPPKGSRHFGGPEVVPVCTFGPYREDILKILREVVAYDIDGLYIDGPYQGWIFEGTLCQCPACKKLFKERFGRPLPENGTHTPEEQRLHREFVADGLTDLLKSIRAIADEKKLPLLFNSCAMEYLGAERQSELSKLADGFLVESSLGGIKGVGKGLAQRKIVWKYTRSHTCWPRSSEPEEEERDARAALLATAQGATPILSYAGRFLYPDACRKPVSDAMKLLKVFESCVAGARPLRHCAVLCPSGLQTQDVQTNNEAASAAYKLLRSVGIQCVALPREALLDGKELEEFSLVILPSFDSLSKEESGNLLQYVSNGGGLLATGTKRLDEKLFKAKLPGRDRKLHALTEKFRWDQAASAPYDCYLRDASGLMPVGEYCIVETLPGANVLADLLIGGDAQGKVPGAVESEIGKGRTVFVPSSVERVWEETRSVRLAEFVAALCKRLSRKPTPFKISTSAQDVFCNAFETANGNLAVHVVDCDATRKTAVRIHLEVHLPENREVEQATCLSNGKEIAAAVAGGWISFPKLPLRKAECVEIKLKRRN